MRSPVAARSVSSESVAPGSTGTPAASIIALASVFEPIDAMASGEGPTNVMPAVAQSRANPAFSDRNPYPGWTASAPVARAAAMIRSPRR